MRLNKGSLVQLGYGAKQRRIQATMTDRTSALGVEISFVRWMGFALPLVVVFLPVVWWLLTRRLFPVTLERGGRHYPPPFLMNPGH